MGAKQSKHLLRNQHGTRTTLTSSNDRKRSMMIMEMIKPECLRTKRMKKMMKKRIQMDQEEKKIKKVRTLTLEEWLLASPGPATYRSADQCFGSSSGGELYVFKQHFSKKVHPSSTSSTATDTKVVNEEVVATTSSTTQYSRDARSLSTDAANVSFSMDVSSSIMSCRSHQSGKLKKRVSFKLPEEADIILFHSPEEKFECDHESS